MAVECGGGWQGDVLHAHLRIMDRVLLRRCAAMADKTPLNEAAEREGRRIHRFLEIESQERWNCELRTG